MLFRLGWALGRAAGWVARPILCIRGDGVASCGQTRRGSALEAVLNVVIGCVVAMFGNAVFLPLVGLPAPSAGQHVALAACFTALSLARSYGVRRLFNRLGI